MMQKAEKYVSEKKKLLLFKNINEEQEKHKRL